MFEWFRRRRATGRVLSLRSRGDLGGAQRIHYAELAPAREVFLTDVADQHALRVEVLATLADGAPAGLRPLLAAALDAARERHAALAELVRGAERADAPSRPLAHLRRVMTGDRPEQTILAVHLVGAMLDDFAIGLADAFGDTGRRVARIVRTDGRMAPLVAVVAATAESDPDAAALLAMWGRRLVGDVLLTARAGLRPAETDADVEPVFTALVTAHTRRMEELGLSA